MLGEEQCACREPLGALRDARHVRREHVLRTGAVVDRLERGMLDRVRRRRCGCIRGERRRCRCARHSRRYDAGWCGGRDVRRRRTPIAVRMRSGDSAWPRASRGCAAAMRTWVKPLPSLPAHARRRWTRQWAAAHRRRTRRPDATRPWASARARSASPRACPCSSSASRPRLGATVVASWRPARCDLSDADGCDDSTARVFAVGRGQATPPHDSPRAPSRPPRPLRPVASA